jgi:hypothetical protein
MTDATDTPTVTVFRAPRVVCPNSDCSSQKVLLVTCTAKSEPAPAARAISTGSSPMMGATGARMPADVIAEIVTEPTATCNAAAMAHTTSSGAAVLAVKYSPRMSPRPAALIVAASEPPTPVRMRICPLSLKPVAIAR